MFVDPLAVGEAGPEPTSAIVALTAVAGPPWVRAGSSAHVSVGGARSTLAVNGPPVVVLPATSLTSCVPDLAATSADPFGTEVTRKNCASPPFARPDPPSLDAHENPALDPTQSIGAALQEIDGAVRSTRSVTGNAAEPGAAPELAGEAPSVAVQLMLWAPLPSVKLPIAPLTDSTGAPLAVQRSDATPLASLAPTSTWTPPGLLTPENHVPETGPSGLIVMNGASLSRELSIAMPDAPALSKISSC